MWADEGLGGMATWREEGMERRPKQGDQQGATAITPTRPTVTQIRVRGKDGVKWIEFRDIWEMKLVGIRYSTNIC